MDDELADKTSDAQPSNTSNSKGSSNQNQFGITALFWTTFLVGLGIAYLQRLNSTEILFGGGIAIAIGVLVGAVIGALTRKIPDALFWATLVAAFAYISVATDPAYSQSHRLIWAVVGAATAAIAATVFTSRPVVSALIGALVAAICMGTYWLVTQNQSVDLKVDLFTAPFVALAVACFVRLLMWLESQQKMARYVTATWLLVVVIIANYFSR